MQPCYPGGSPYGSSQSDADGIAATSVLMRSSFALMSDNKRWSAQQSARQHTIECVHTVQTHNYCMCVFACQENGADTSVQFITSCRSLRARWVKPVVLLNCLNDTQAQFFSGKKCYITIKRTANRVKPWMDCTDLPTQTQTLKGLFCTKRIEFSFTNEEKKVR